MLHALMVEIREDGYGAGIEAAEKPWSRIIDEDMAIAPDYGCKALSHIEGEHLPA